MTQRVDLRQVLGLADERIVVGSGAVLVQPQHLADVGARVLRTLPGRRRPDGAPDRHVQLPVRPEHDPRRGDATTPPVGHEKVAHFGQRPAVETAARQRDRRATPAVALHWFGVGEVNKPVVLGMDGDIHQTGQSGTGIDLWHPRNRRGVEHAVANHPQGPGVAFGHEDVAVAQKGEAPRMGKPGGDRHHTNPWLVGAVEHHRPVWQCHRRHAAQRRRALSSLGGGGADAEDDAEDAGDKRPDGRRTANSKRVHGATSVWRFCSCHFYLSTIGMLGV